MPRQYEFIASSVVAAPQQAVWDRISTPAGVNDEFRPLFRMTFPPEVEQLDPATVPIGERICRSWVLLFGFLPVDYDDLTLVSVDPPRGFLERSTMLSQRMWEHERTLETAPGGTRVTDRIRFEPRLPLVGGLGRALYRAVFGYRHRRLRKRFGAPQS